LTGLEAALARPTFLQGRARFIFGPFLSHRASCEMCDDGDQEEDEKDHEKYLGNSSSCNRNSREPEHSRNQCDHKKD